MNKKAFSPYIRTAMFSVIKAPFHINKRVIFDYEIIYVSDGKCEIIIDGKKYLCKKNDVVFIRPDIPHEFKSAGVCDFVQQIFQNTHRLFAERIQKIRRIICGFRPLTKRKSAV